MIFLRHKHPERRIAKQLIYYLILTSACITLIITAYQLYRDYSYDMHQINYRFVQIEHVYLTPLSHALWTTDKKEMQLQIDGMKRLPDIQYIAVYSDNKILVSAGIRKQTNIIAHSFPLTYEYRGELRKIGQLQIIATLDGVYSRLFDKIWLILVSNGIKTLIIASFFLYIFQLLVTRHINHMADQVRVMDADSLGKPITLERSTNRNGADEFDVLIKAFDDMRIRIAEGFEKVKRREQDLMLYEMIMATTEDQMSYIDRDYTYRAVNMAYTKMTGVSSEQIIGKTVQDLMREDSFVNVSIPNLDKVFEGNFLTTIVPVVDRSGKVVQMEVNYYPYYGDSDIVQGVVINARDVTERVCAEQERLRNSQVYAALAQQGAIEYKDFLYSSMVLLKDVFQSKCAMIGRLVEGTPQIQTQCVLYGDQQIDNFIYDLTGTPCEKVFDKNKAFYYREVSELFPQDQILVEMEAQTYFGVSLVDAEGKSHGILAVLDTEPREPDAWHEDIMKIFAARIAVEMERADALDKLERYNEMLEEQVAVRTYELQNSLSELETFSYSVSHDLRAPLRAINGYSQILIEEYSDSLGQEGVRYLGKIKSGSEKMSLLIDSLLRLSRISRQSIELEYTNLSKLCKNIFKNHNELEGGKKLCLMIQSDIYASCDVKLIRIALENLIDNAIKYSAREISPEIVIGIENIDGIDAFYIRDNGVGFDPQFMDVIFQPFQRLHNNDFSGTGIGLATVQRIINRHGGKIWAESIPQHGASFYFVLPDLYSDLQGELYSAS